MKNEILKKLGDHDKRFDDHDKRFDAIDKKFDDHDKRFDVIEKRLDGHDKRFDTLTNVVLKNSRDIKEIKETMATKKDLTKITNTLDELVGLAKKKDQEMTFMSQRLTRVEKFVGMQ